MRHPSEKQLVLFSYGEAVDPAVEPHVAACSECRPRLEALRRLLESVRLPVPERGADYGTDVWRRFATRLESRSAARIIRPSVFATRLAIATVAAAFALAAFLAGRFWQQADKGADPISGAARERVLQLAVGDHLERSQVMLVELVNSNPGGPGSPRDQERAEELVAANRLYRQTAARSGDARVTDVLDELELVLMEIARSPAPLSPEEQDSLRRRIEGQGLLFKVRVLTSRLREQERRQEVFDANRERKRT